MLPAQLKRRWARARGQGAGAHHSPPHRRRLSQGACRLSGPFSLPPRKRWMEIPTSPSSTPTPVRPLGPETLQHPPTGHGALGPMDTGLPRPGRKGARSPHLGLHHPVGTSLAGRGLRGVPNLPKDTHPKLTGRPWGPGAWLLVPVALLLRLLLLLPLIWGSWDLGQDWATQACRTEPQCHRVS